MAKKQATRAARNGNGAEVDFEDPDSEKNDRDSSPVAYQILTYPADFTLEVLVDKWRKGDINIPKFQRRFVWTSTQASKLIESFLLGLPVPPIFLYAKPGDNTLLVVDGQQRLKSIAYFFEGYFGEEERGRRPVFRLQGLSENSPYLNKTFSELETGDNAAYRRLIDSVLRSFVVKQLDPADDTSIVYIFERLNTGGTLLHPQEIRNCIFHGGFNDLLAELNGLDAWRDIMGNKTEDKRFRDLELILRFFALLYSLETYEKPMKEFLNKFMSRNKNPAKTKIKEYKEVFESTAQAVVDSLGTRPFHIRAGLNAAVFDAVFVAFAKVDSIPNDIEKRYRKLIADNDFEGYISASTTDKEIVPKRINLARKTLFGR